MKRFIVAYIGTVITFLTMDAIWLGVIARDFYMTQMAGMLRDTTLIAPAIIFYAMYAAIIVYLVILPNAARAKRHTIIAGALLGVAAYGAYDMTNYALIAGWSIELAMVDWVWGAVVTGTSALCGRAVLARVS